jgi:hypothetical protein
VNTQATHSLTDLATSLEEANRALEDAKLAEQEAIEARKAAASDQRLAQQAFNEAVNSLKRRRAPKAEKTVKPRSVKKSKKAEA